MSSGPPNKRFRQATLFECKPRPRSTDVKSFQFVSNYGFNVLCNPPSDGQCQFTAVAHQLTTFANTSTDALILRDNVVKYLTDKCESFQNFITSKSWVEYLRDMAMSNTHGDHITLLAAARLYSVQFLVISSLGAQSTTLITPNGTQTHGNCILKFDPRLPLLSLGHSAEEHAEHYVSLSQVSDDSLSKVVSTAKVFMTTTPTLLSTETNTAQSVIYKQRDAGNGTDCDSPQLASVDNSDVLKSDRLAAPKGISEKSWEKWRKGRPWLACDAYGKVFCSACSEVSKSGIGVAKTERLRIEDAFVVGLISTRKKLLKKIYKHGSSISHETCVSVKERGTSNALTAAFDKAITVWDEANVAKISATCKVFNVAYTCVKEEMAYMKHPALIELMEKNGMDHCSMLFSDHACSDITKHIAKTMMSHFVKYVNDSEHPFSVLVDESTTVSSQTGLIIYIRIPVSNEVCNIFFSLVELCNGATGVNIAKAIYDCMVSNGIRHEVLESRMMGFASDGASVMRGEHSGTVAELKAILKTDFKSFHCMAHRLELAVNSSVKSCGEIQRLQMFTDSLYAFYHRSPKNLYELTGVANSLQSELKKISQVFTVRWVFSTYRAVKAFLVDYAPLCRHMQQISEDKRRHAKDRAKCSGFLKKLLSWQFVAELLLLVDCLEVLWHLSSYLQSRSASLIDVHHKLTVALKTLSAMKNISGLNLCQLCTGPNDATSSQYEGVRLHRTDNDTSNFDNARKKFLQALIDNLSARFPESDLLSAGAALDYSTWPLEADSLTLFGDTSVALLAKAVGLSVSEAVNAFREHKNNRRKEIKLITDLRLRVLTFPISTAECERGFSTMNRIQTEQRNRLHMEALSCLLFICINGPPLVHFEPYKYVVSWMKSGHHSAKDRQTGKPSQQALLEARHKLFI